MKQDAPISKPRRFLKRTLWVALTFTIALLAFAAIFPRPPAPPEMPAGILPGSPPYLTILLLDGLSQDVLQELLAEGRMPNLQRLMDRGATIENAIGAFPSVTGFAFYPFITGEDAARSGIFGLRWFDRSRQDGAFRNYVGRTNRQMNGDLNALPQTVFEKVAPEYTSAFNSYMNRGVVQSYQAGWSYTMAKYQQQWWVVNCFSALSWVNPRLAPDWQQAEASLIDLAIADLQLKPRVQWLTLAAPDGYHHINGSAPGYREIIAGLDVQLGRYIAASESLGISEQQILCIVTDHGMVDVIHNIDPPADIERATGIRLRRGKANELESDELHLSAEELQDFDGIFAINGNNAALIYMRGNAENSETAWKERVTEAQLRKYTPVNGALPGDIIATLQRMDGIELIITRRKDGTVLVQDYRGSGTGMIQANGNGGYSYRTTGEDPLGYDRSPQTAALLDGAFYTRRQWLEATVLSEFPFAPVRLYELMSQPGSPDIALTTLPEYDFGRDYELFVGNYRGGHGGLRAEQTRVTYVIAGPGIAKDKRMNTATAEDLGATVIHLTGLPLEPNLSGRILHELISDSQLR